MENAVVAEIFHDYVLDQLNEDENFQAEAAVLRYNVQRTQKIMGSVFFNRSWNMRRIGPPVAAKERLKNAGGGGCEKAAQSQ